MAKKRVVRKTGMRKPSSTQRRAMTKRAHARYIARKGKAPTKIFKKVGKWFKKKAKKWKQGVGKVKLLWKTKVRKKMPTKKDLKKAGMLTPELEQQFDMMEAMKKGGGAAGGAAGASGGSSGEWGSLGGQGSGGSKPKAAKLLPNMAGNAIASRWAARNKARAAKAKELGGMSYAPTTKRSIKVNFNSTNQKGATAGRNSKGHYQNNFKAAVRPKALHKKNSKYKY